MLIHHTSNLLTHLLQLCHIFFSNDFNLITVVITLPSSLYVTLIGQIFALLLSVGDLLG